MADMKFNRSEFPRGDKYTPREDKFDTRELDELGEAFNTLRAYVQTHLTNAASKYEDEVEQARHGSSDDGGRKRNGEYTSAEFGDTVAGESLIGLGDESIDDTVDDEHDSSHESPGEIAEDTRTTHEKHLNAVLFELDRIEDIIGRALEHEQGRSELRNEHLIELGRLRAEVEYLLRGESAAAVIPGSHFNQYRFHVVSIDGEQGQLLTLEQKTEGPNRHIHPFMTWNESLGPVSYLQRGFVAGINPVNGDGERSYIGVDRGLGDSTYSLMGGIGLFEREDGLVAKRRTSDNNAEYTALDTIGYQSDKEGNLRFYLFQDTPVRALKWNVATTFVPHTDRRFQEESAEDRAAVYSSTLNMVTGSPDFVKAASGQVSDGIHDVLAVNLTDSKGQANYAVLTFSHPIDTSTVQVGENGFSLEYAGKNITFTNYFR